jgi:hypothetical protein
VNIYLFIFIPTDPGQKFRFDFFAWSIILLSLDIYYEKAAGKMHDGPECHHPTVSIAPPQPDGQ